MGKPAKPWYPGKPGRKPGSRRARLRVRPAKVVLDDNMYRAVFYVDHDDYKNLRKCLFMQNMGASLWLRNVIKEQLKAFENTKGVHE